MVNTRKFYVSIRQRFDYISFIKDSVVSPPYLGLVADKEVAKYNDYLSNWEIDDQEVRLWKQKWLTHIKQTVNIILSIKTVRRESFPKVVCPITNRLHVTRNVWVWKRFSAMRRLITCPWTSVLRKQLNALAIRNIHWSHPVNYTEVAHKFFIFYSRKITYNSLIFSLEI